MANRLSALPTVLAAGWLLLASCTVQDTALRVGQPPPSGPAPVVSSRVAFAGVSVPLPEGQWERIGELRDSSIAGFPQRYAIFTSSAEGVLDRAIVVWQQSRTNARDWFTPYAHCVHGTYPHAVTYVNARNNHACWHVRPLSLGLGSETPQNQAIFDYAARRDLYQPLTMIGVRFVSGQGMSRSYIEYLFNPDLLLPRSDGRPWRARDWEKGAVAGDPSRRAVVDALAAWGEEWQVIAVRR